MFKRGNNLFYYNRKNRELYINKYIYVYVKDLYIFIFTQHATRIFESLFFFYLQYL